MADKPIKAAGILFVSGAPATGTVFLARRTGSTHAGEWAFPAGHVEDGESAEQAAIREAGEELGGVLAGTRKLFARSVTDGVDFSTFLQVVKSEFEPRRLDEHDKWGWFPRNALPEPLHPGAALAISKLTMDETEVAQAIADGRLTSPQVFENNLLIALRVTGTGTSYREKLKEYVFRPPENYLNQHFLDRCRGLPVILEHPAGDTLNTKEFAERVIGTIALPYIQGDEVWGIARIYDVDAAQALATITLSTSPAVVFRYGDDETIKLNDGFHLLIEGKPSLLDHLAICELGVWDKGGPAAGVSSITARKDSQNMADEKELIAGTGGEDTKTDKKDDAARHDAEAGEKLDKVLACLDSFGKKFDTVGQRLDALEEARQEKPKADAKKDAEEEPEAKKDEALPAEIAGMPEQTAADKAKKDAATKAWRTDRAKKDAKKDGEAEGEAGEAEGREKIKEGLEKEMAGEREEHRTDSELKSRLDALESRMKCTDDDDDDKKLAVQAKADSAYAALGTAAPRALRGESLLSYRRRLVSGLQKHSRAWSGIDVKVLPSEALGVAEGQIYADAIEASRNPTDLAPNQLREIVRADSTGRRITEFVGDPMSWMQQFSCNRRRVTGIRNGSR